MKKNYCFPIAVFFLATALCFSCSKGTGDDTSSKPKVTGPVEVTPESYPFNAANHSEVPQDLKASNYAEEEYFVSGKANVYDYDAAGKVIVKIPDAPYTTRILVRRPIDKSKFSGNVIVELNNPTALLDQDLQWMSCRDFFIENGDIWVGITIKPVSIEALKKFNPERYDSLSMDNPAPPEERCEIKFNPLNDQTPETESGLAWDIVSQVGALLKSNDKLNPVKDYNAQYLFATGYSQTGIYLVTYINRIHPLDTAKLANGKPIFDGYMIGDGEFGSVPLNQCADLDPDVIIKPCGVPVISVAAQGTLNESIIARRPDGDTKEDRYRRYEIPGSAHANQQSRNNAPNSEDIIIAGGSPLAPNCEGVNEYGLTDFPLEFFMDAAFQNLYAWARNGTPPPEGEFIETEKAEGGDEVIVKTDEHGNALGGIRNPYVDVPVATYYGYSTPLDEESAFLCSLLGYKKPFDDDKIRSLYPTKDDYVNKVRAIADRMVNERFLTKSDGEKIKEEAQEVNAW